MKRFICGIGVGFWGVAGCALPYPMLPTASYVPACDVAEPEDRTIHIFRVSVDTNRRTKPALQEDDYEFQETKLRDDAKTPFAFQVGFAYGEIGIPADRFHDSFVLIRAYRRGYRTQERTQQIRTPIQWIPAPRFWEKEQAVDDLIKTSSGDQLVRDPEHQHAGLRPGSASAEQKRFLLFAAGEYDWLASLVPDENRDAKRRVQEKAEAMRQLAEK